MRQAETTSKKGLIQKGEKPRCTTRKDKKKKKGKSLLAKVTYGVGLEGGSSVPEREIPREGGKK